MSAAEVLTKEEAAEAALLVGKAAMETERLAVVLYVRACADRTRAIAEGVADPMAKFAARHQAETLSLLADKLEQKAHHPREMG